MGDEFGGGRGVWVAHTKVLNAPMAVSYAAASKVLGCWFLLNFGGVEG